MSFSEKILMRKIKRLEQQKQKIVQDKKRQKDDDEETSELVAKLQYIKDNNLGSDDEHVEQQKKKKVKTEHSESQAGILSDTTFESLNTKLNDKILRALNEMGYTHLTKIQEQTIPVLLNGRHLLAYAKTGSGKTLAFLTPAIYTIMEVGFKPRNGTGALIISPTRELAMQTYSVLHGLMKYGHHTYGLIMGGVSRKTEAAKLSKGVNILVATPGRLLDHMLNTPEFMYHNVQYFVIDECDRILDIGFEEEMTQIINLLPSYRQTILFSATQNKKTESLISLAMKNKKPQTIELQDTKPEATVEGLEDGYMVCPDEKRLFYLSAFLRKCLYENSKVMVFYNSTKSVDFHHKLFNSTNITVMSIHGKQKQTQRTTTFFQFCSLKCGVLLCTDIAARGLDIPMVDWVIQYDAPYSTKEYIHRVGRTARGEQSKGRALLMLRPQELEFLGYLKAANALPGEVEINWSKVTNDQKMYDDFVQGNGYMKNLAKEAFTAYLKSYESHNLKNVFNVKNLEMDKECRSFCLFAPQIKYITS